MSNIGPMEIVGLLLLALLLFGAKRLPEIGRSLGSGMREFKDSVSGDKKAEVRSELPPPAPVVSAAGSAAAEAEGGAPAEGSGAAGASESERAPEAVS